MSRRERWSHALRDPSTWGRALRVGAPVGVLQAAIHQGDAWLRLAVDAAVLTKSVMSPLVSFALVWVGAAGAMVGKATETTTDER